MAAPDNGDEAPNGSAAAPDNADKAPNGAPAAPDADDLVFKALASPVRRRMLDVLKETSRTTGALAGELPGLDRTTVLQHLRVLERAGLVTGRKVGRERHLSLAPMPIRRIHDRWISGYMAAAVELLEDLDAE